MLYWLCTGSVLALYWLCTGSVLALYWLYTGSVLALYWLCTGSVLALYWLLDLLRTCFWTCSVLAFGLAPHLLLDLLRTCFWTCSALAFGLALHLLLDLLRTCSVLALDWLLAHHGLALGASQNNRWMKPRNYRHPHRHPHSEMTNRIAVVLSDKKWRVFRASEESTRGNWGIRANLSPNFQILLSPCAWQVAINRRTCSGTV